MRKYLRAWIIGIGLVTLMATGCEVEPIQSYQVARPKTRLLGAMIPRDDGVWFVKMVGSAEAMAEVQPAFDTFLRSIRFPDNGDELITWDLPDGWKAERRRAQGRYATIIAPLGLELTVTTLSAPLARDKLANVNRWRNQLGLKKVKQEGLKDICSEIEIGGVKTATRVDMTGAVDELSKIPAPPIQYEIPDGWARMQPLPVQEALFRAGDGQKVEVSIAIAGGTLAGNVNRWRKQVGLPEGDDNEIHAQLKPYRFTNGSGFIVDLTGERNEGILGIIAPRDDDSWWFFQAKGPAPEIEKLRASIEKFLSSVRFTERE